MSTPILPVDPRFASAGARGPRVRTIAARATVATLIAAAGVLLSYETLGAQTPSAGALTLGGAAKLAAERSATTAAARERSSQADARVAQRRSEFLPTISTTAQLGTRSFNTP